MVKSPIQVLLWTFCPNLKLFNGIQQYKTFKSDPNLLARPSPPPLLAFCPNIEVHEKLLQFFFGKGWTLPSFFRAMPVFRQKMKGTYANFVFWYNMHIGCYFTIYWTARDMLKVYISTGQYVHCNHTIPYWNFCGPDICLEISTTFK